MRARDLRPTPALWALRCLLTPVGSRSIIESFWERSSPEKRPAEYAPRSTRDLRRDLMRDFEAPIRWAALLRRWQLENHHDRRRQ